MCDRASRGELVYRSAYPEGHSRDPAKCARIGSYAAGPTLTIGVLLADLLQNSTCERTTMQQPAHQMSRDYARIEAAIQYLYAHRKEQPGLESLAAEVAHSPHHFQRLFRRWSGVTPKQLLSYLTVRDAKALLANHWSVLDTSDEVGLSGPARLHDAFVSVEGMTPGEFKNGGEALHIRVAQHPSPFGLVRVMETERGICGLEFVAEAAAPSVLLAEWPNATITQDKHVGRTLVRSLSNGTLDESVSLHLRGTNFQLQVWRALLQLPFGRITSYRSLAAAAGSPRAARAVGSTMARNPVAWLIPCHRVVRAVTDLGAYRYGDTRKRAMVAWECAQVAGAKQLSAA